MSKKQFFTFIILFVIFFSIISLFYFRVNIGELNIQVEKNIERNLSRDWGPKEPQLFAEDYSADILNLSLFFKELVIKIPVHKKSHIFNLTEKIFLDGCFLRINLVYLLLELNCNNLTVNYNHFIFHENKQIVYSKNFYFDSDIFQRLFTRFRFFDLKFHFNQVLMNKDLYQNINGQLEFYNDKKATLMIDDRFVEFFNRSEGLEIHHQNQKFFFLNQNFFQHFLD